MTDGPDFGFVLPHWLYWTWLAVMPLVLIYWANLQEKRKGKLQPETDGVSLPQDEGETIQYVENTFTRAIDKVSVASGYLCAFWTVNAVIAYFYEVIMRYLFNMPTIWVHEASFLLFGMQYLISGAFTLKEEGHVRVDVLYIKLPLRGRVGMDIFTSVFFFVFILALVGTSATFFEQSYEMGETTVETWAIQYWPVKAMMLLGGILILFAGIAKLTKDIMTFRALGQEGQFNG
ncbi:C4-dicarboxylate ABC transporter permease [Kiloniella spongiae]|uniref:TRAP transporter small permease protein n=1 Tax=Kiloniella spongiae TaxID=1489064 RepID=A0A0H2MAQ7_9PROT|nr:TRAP transporter small permease subunit [Kiloniella spongiae]KLN59609.1 C4-dicarboxylate ABC transporter permease [Kiloniella spongiae]